MHDLISVYLENCDSYHRNALKYFFDSTLGRAPDFRPRSAMVCIKPNLISAKGSGLGCTDGRFLVVLGEWLIDNGAKVKIGDSPAFGKATGVLRALGCADQLQRKGVVLTDFQKVVRKRLACGQDIGIAAESLDCDYLINAAKLKAHSQMYVTMAVKNIFGIVLGVRKSMLHMRHGGADGMFARIILDLLEILPPHFSFIDGVVAMHKQGPLQGEPLDLGLIGFSKDPVALDTSVLHALQLDPIRSPLWREIRQRSLAAAELANISFPLLPPESFYGSHFEVPQELSPIRFNPLRFLWNSLKRSALRLGLK